MTSGKTAGFAVCGKALSGVFSSFQSPTMANLRSHHTRLRSGMLGPKSSERALLIICLESQAHGRRVAYMNEQKWERIEEILAKMRQEFI